jgi:hypothetical protein
MNTLQKIFEKEVVKQFSYPVVAAKIVKKQLEKKGIALTKEQVGRLEEKFQDSSGNALTFDIDLDDDQNKILGMSDGEKVDLDIGDPDQMLDEMYQEFVANLKDSIPEITNEMALPILSDLRKNAPVMLKEHRRERRSFENRLAKDWKKPFDLLETFLVIAFEAGDELNKEYRKDPAERKNYVLEALTRLHARACQIAREVLMLLKSGYADGAHARWRSLHEIAVVGSFIKTHGNVAAEKYLLHDRIESFKAATLYQKYYEALGDAPISQDEYDSIKAVRDKLVTRFGNSYKNNYGWASSALNKEDPTFVDIEGNSGLDHLRPYYKLASHNVHANPKGIMFKLGLLEDTQNILLAGPSNVGFTDPAQGTAISLGIITITLLTAKPTIDNLVVSNILLKLESEIGEEFLKVQKEIENREATYRLKAEARRKMKEN